MAKTGEPMRRISTKRFGGIARDWSIIAGSRPITGSISMTSGHDMSRKFAIAAVLALALGPAQSRADPPEQAPSAWTLDSLMAGLQQVKSASAHFVERKEMAMLTRALESTGTLSYVAPDRLEKITLTPAPETITLQGETLTGVQADGQHYTVSLNDRPEVATLVEGVRS